MGSQDTHQGSSMQAARIAAGYTIVDVALRLCRNTATVTRWETGKHQPSRDVLLTLANLYAVTPAELVD